MAKGGARIGAGRPKLDTTKIREAIVRIATENAEALAQALHDKAIKGDVPALKEIYDRSIGKVTDNSHLNVEIRLVCDV